MPLISQHQNICKDKDISRILLYHLKIAMHEDICTGMYA